MSVILGIGPPAQHDPSAAVMVDGRLVAAAEEERFLREKHAANRLPVQAVRFCLNRAGLKPGDIEAVAFAWCPIACHRAKWHFAADMLTTSWQEARRIISKAERINRAKERLVKETLVQSGIDPARVKIRFVEHHLAHAASSYLFSGFTEAAFLSIDGSGEFITTLLGEVRDGRFHKFIELYNPNSLGQFYSTVTEYLGFEPYDGEYKVMGMAPYGDPEKVDLSGMIWTTRSGFKVSNEYVWVVEPKRYRKDRMYSRRLVEEFGPPRQGDGLSAPYIHLAAATQRALEDIALFLVERHLTGSLTRHRTLCLAGGCALNVCMNKRLLAHPLVDRLFVPPAANDAGTSVGAAAYVAYERGEPIEPMASAYYGPGYEAEEIRRTLERAGLPYQTVEDIADEAAALVARGEVVGWFQGRMELGPRALGNRSILGHPAVPGTRDKINAVVKFREGWRPFCPSILAEHAEELFDSTHPFPFMTVAVDVSPRWRSKIPEVVHVDGTARPQTVSRTANPRFYDLIEKFYKKTGLPLVLNTSLNRRGEPIVCTPEDAVRMFLGSGLRHLCLGDFLVSKRL